MDKANLPQRPEKLYRYCNEETADYILSGSFKLGTLQEYRAQDNSTDLMASEHCDGGLTDGFEGTEEMNVHKPCFWDPNVARDLEHLGLPSKGTNIIIQENTFRFRLPNMYVTSFARSYSIQDHETWLKKEGYTCCVEINEPLAYIELANIICSYQQWPIVYRWDVGDVQYDWVPKMVGQGIDPANPFRKRAAYQWQKETRIVCWYPDKLRDQMEPSKAYIFKDEKLSKYCSLLPKLK